MKLTDEQILALWSGSAEAVRPVLGSKKVLAFARAIEAALTAKQGEVGREHISSAECWCFPELDYVDPVTGSEVWIHKEPQ